MTLIRKTIKLDSDTIRKIDNLRGMIPFSAYVRNLIEQSIKRRKN